MVRALFIVLIAWTCARPCAAMDAPKSTPTPDDCFSRLAPSEDAFKALVRHQMKTNPWDEQAFEAIFDQLAARLRSDYVGTIKLYKEMRAEGLTNGWGRGLDFFLENGPQDRFLTKEEAAFFLDERVTNFEGKDWVAYLRKQIAQSADPQAKVAEFLRWREEVG
ncbi:hypothetical protein K2X33_10995, partial [bacterium]|nr:hypothetical protein [bacterium]